MLADPFTLRMGWPCFFSCKFCVFWRINRTLQDINQLRASMQTTTPSQINTPMMSRMKIKHKKHLFEQQGKHWLAFKQSIIKTLVRTTSRNMRVHLAGKPTPTLEISPPNFGEFSKSNLASKTCLYRVNWVCLQLIASHIMPNIELHVAINVSARASW